MNYDRDFDVWSTYVCVDKKLKHVQIFITHYVTFMMYLLHLHVLVLNIW